MNPRTLIGIVLLVAGAILFTIGLNASESFADQWSEFFTGHYTDETVWSMIGGGLLAVVGLMGILFTGSRAAA